MTKYFIPFFLFITSLYGGTAVQGWYPEDFDVAAAAEGVATILDQQGKDVDNIGIENIIFTDADHTLLKTMTPILLRDTSTGQLVKDPKDGTLLRLPNRGAFSSLQLLKQELPSLPWDSIEVDYMEMGSVVALDVTETIDSMVAVLMSSDKMSKNREYIITARSDDDVAAAMEDYFLNLGIDINGVFAVNNATIGDTIGYSEHHITIAQKKALIIEAILHLYTSHENTIKSVSFYDDNDDNLVVAMNLLPELFPKIDFSFYDVVHEGNNIFTIHNIANAKDGILVSPEGEKLSDEDIEYHSYDAPIPDE
ncbi:MAG: hypothetical protein HN411_02340 [Waddliaceae bacterium]|jgi:hypothetical protein|nr:hypothetical protein [Waddliaceae bacterium]MBT3578749.1 hypothetical protein [Waddliaceae bacterium]MBT4444349.1 hypothetical protein [Waddliaceae bacterium]MBT6929090.1 hypothetical protein [Waddliaceae bacterium]MBT7264376.1 hypothetical protein [Waddliaceae bacterium]